MAGSDQGFGASYVIFGKASGFTATINLSSLDGSNGFKINGAAAGDLSGRHVASAGDVNGDGFADVIIGAYFASPNGSGSGASYVVFGHAPGFSASLNLSDLNGSNGFRIAGAAAGDASGHSVSSAGDLNGDGFDDIIVGADYADPNGTSSGASYVIFGKASGFAASINLSTLNGSNGFKLDGVAAGDDNGRSVSSAGDVNGDGFADIVVSSWRASPNGTYSGAGYVVFGKAGGFSAEIDLSSLTGSNGFKLSGAAAGDFSGYSVSSAGDFNGDGFADIIVSAHGADPNGDSSGSAYVVFGRASGFAANVALSGIDGNNGFRLDGVAAGDHAGESVAGAGDVNGDGFDDLIVGAPAANPHQTGAAYVIYGGMPGEAVTRTGTDIANTIHGGNFNDTLSGLGGDDILYGHAGNDLIDGGTGNDTMYGGDGADTFVGGAGNDAMDGGEGRDAVDYSADTQGVSVDLTLGTASGAGIGGDTLVNIRDVFGGTGNDSLSGNKAVNNLVGGAGKDVLKGEKGDDTLSGGAGRDTLNGGLGADLLDGGAGKDHFKYSAAVQSTGATFDTVVGFNQHDGDQFVLAFAVTGIDVTVSGGHFSKPSADADLAAAVTSGALGAHHALLFAPTTGDQHGGTFLVVDANGVAGYQAGQDLVIKLDAPVAFSALTTGDFA